MSFPGTGFIARTSIPFGGFVVAFGFESGTGQPFVPVEIPEEFVEGRRDVRIGVALARGPKVLLYLSGDREEEGRSSARATVRRAPRILIRTGGRKKDC